MVSTSVEHLDSLFNTEELKDLSVGYRKVVDTLDKDIFPNGMMKFSMRTFFNELLDDKDREFLLSIPKKKITQLCNEAIRLANEGRSGTSFALEDQVFPAAKFYDYTFKGVDSVIEGGIEKLPDPLLAVFSKKTIGTSEFGRKKDGSIKRAGVVEFRAPEQGDTSIACTRSLAEEAVARYETFCERVSKSPMLGTVRYTGQPLRYREGR